MRTRQRIVDAHRGVLTLVREVAFRREASIVKDAEEAGIQGTWVG